MPPRVGRRGKGPRGQMQQEEQAIDPPSKLLPSILKTLSLTFERDIGMLNGKNVRSVPPKSALIELRGQLEKLLTSLSAIAESDGHTIESLKKLKESHDAERARKVQKAQKSQKAEKSRKSQKSEKSRPQKSVSALKGVQDLSQNDTPAADAGLEDKNKIKELPVDSKFNNQLTEDVSDDGSETADVAVITKRRKRSLNIDNDDEAEEAYPEKPTDSIPVSPSKKMKLDEDSQVDVDKVENDPSVKNPKSEFVVSQTLPAAAAALGLFNEQGLESTGEENLKKRYDVASYPTDDLKELLPGELPDMDFSHPKPTNQIQYGTFLSSVESFFRVLNDDDIKFLKSKYIIPASLEMDKTYDPEITPYIIPKLGPLYTENWLKEDSNDSINTSPPPVNDPTSILPRKSAADISDATLDTDEISCGPLVSRLLSAILKDEGDQSNLTHSSNVNNGTSVRIKEENGQTPIANSTNGSLVSQEQTPNAIAAQIPISGAEDTAKPLADGTTSTVTNPQLWKINSINLDYPTFEERLKRELKYVGIYVNMPRDENNPNPDDPDWLTGREDDELSAELRELQNSLKQVTVKNEKRKTALIPLIERRLAWQEFSSILDDLDKQIDQAYVKRIRVPKKRKKHHSAAMNTINTESASQAAQQKAANSSLKALLDKRQRWISKIGPLFDKFEVMKRIPKESVFRDIDQDEEEEETDLFGQNGNGKEDELADA